MAESAISAVLGNVGNLAVQETSFLWGVTLEVTFLKDELIRLQGYLKDGESKRKSGNQSVATLMNQIRDAAYEAENVIEAAEYMKRRNRIKQGFMGAISRYARLPSDLTTLHKVGSEIQRVRRKLSEIFQSVERLKINMDIHPVDEYLEDYGLMHQNFQDDVLMVGFEDEYKEIVDKLLHGENMLSAVSIVAMGGAGKTTLARKVYTSSAVKQHFEALVWVTVSQKFKVSDLLKKVLKQISSDGYQSRTFYDMDNKEIKIDDMDEDRLGKEIHGILMQKRYLIVLDDVWETDTWNQINRTVKAFPDAANCSRVLLTTRKQDVANHVEMPTDLHALRCLDEEKSWVLFSSKALPSYRMRGISNLDKFEELGRKLTRKCDGLPLAIAVLGGYLSKNLNIQAWSDVLMCWPSTKDTKMMQNIIARSYTDLPNHYLRCCFLYLAAFPEDSIISTSDLMNLWITENLIPRTRNQTLQETARKYVTELVQRSMVQVAKTNGTYGWSTEIKIHDIIRDWCIEEATRDGFLDVMDETTRGQVGASSYHTLISYRSSFQNSSDHILQASPNLRALLGFGLQSVSFPELRFLRVLHVENLKIVNFAKLIGGCIHLRHLGMRRCQNVTIHSSIRKLLYLQTIDISGSNVSIVSSSIWDVQTLRYANIHKISLPRSVQILQTLQELHMMAAREETKKDPMRILGMLPCLVVLELSGYEPKTMSFGAQGFPRLQELTLKDCGFKKCVMKVGTMPKLFCLSFSKTWWYIDMPDMPEGLLHLPSLSFVSLCYETGLDWSKDSTLEGLKQKGCEVLIEKKE